MQYINTVSVKEDAIDEATGNDERFLHRWILKNYVHIALECITLNGTQ